MALDSQSIFRGAAYTAASLAVLALATRGQVNPQIVKALMQSPEGAYALASGTRKALTYQGGNQGQQLPVSGQEEGEQAPGMVPEGALPLGSEIATA